MELHRPLTDRSMALLIPDEKGLVFPDQNIFYWCKMQPAIVRDQHHRLGLTDLQSLSQINLANTISCLYDKLAAMPE